jgi:hypothetical protein
MARSEGRVMNVNVEVEEITPTIANEYLLKNTHNRNIRQHQVAAFAEDMARGNWQTGAGTIKFDVNDVLIDGQHTLSAIVKSDKTLSMVVIRGLPTESQMAIDTGAKRTFADTLRLQGVNNYSYVAVLTRSIYDWNLLGPKMFSGGQASSVSTNKILWDFYQSNRWIDDLVQLASKLQSSIGIPSRVSGALINEFNNVSAEDAAFFFERIINGDNLSVGQAAYTLRKTLHDLSNDKRRSQADQKWMAAIIIKAWNKYIDGEECNILSWRPGGRNKEPFPAIKKPRK